MRFIFDINPTEMNGKTIVAIIIAALIFIVVPIVLSIAQHKLTKQKGQKSVYLFLVVFASALILGIYSLLVGVVLLAVHFITINKLKATKEN